MDHYIVAARQALAGGDRSQAQQLLDQAMSLSPNNGEIWYLLGELSADPNQRTAYMNQAALLGYQPNPDQSPYQGQYQSPYQGQYQSPYQGQYPPQPLYGAPQRRGSGMTAIVVVVGLLMVLGAGVVWFLVRIPDSSSATILALPIGTVAVVTGDPGQAFVTGEYIPAVEEPNHIPADTTHTYNSNPPTSGNHWGRAAPWGMYLDTPPRDEALVHNLEHGGVIISFNPELVSGDEQSQLEELYAELSAINPRVILTVRSNLDVPVALTAWEYRQLLDTVDIEAVQAFYDEHIAQGPECNQGRCPQ